jgi:O-antigen/teichoic acid export membrane protein
MIASPSRIVADSLGASVGILVIRNVLRKQHRLQGAALAIRWAIIICGIAIFEMGEHGLTDAHWGFISLEAVGLILACFFFVFPDISFYLFEGYKQIAAHARIHDRPTPNR